MFCNTTYGTNYAETQDECCIERQIYWHYKDNHNTNLLSDSSEHAPSHTSICIGCGQEIFDRYILRVAPDLEWHASCLRCVHCHRFLDESCTAFIRDGKPFCKADYVRLFGAKCGKCGLCFAKNDCVMRAKERMYHMDCFRCVCCHRRLMPGDEFALRHEEIYCRTDHEMLLTQSLGSGSLVVATGTPGALTASHMHDPSGSGNNSIMALGNNNSVNSNNNNLDSDSNNNNKLIKTDDLLDDEDKCVMMTSVSQASDDSSRMGGGPYNRDVTSSLSQHTSSRFGSSLSKKDKKDKSKTTRIRTVLNEKQLHTLRTCYAANPRPDALMKEQLVEMTGLNPRVIRVWFQNKRCKDKKRQVQLKNMQQQHEKNQALAGVRLQGIGPLMATPGGPHSEQIGQLLHTVDVHQMQQSPAMWTPIQPGGDIDGNGATNAFQQLMHGFGDGSDSHLHAFSMQSHGDSQFDGDIDSFSPGMAGSDLSSASCSD